MARLVPASAALVLLAACSSARESATVPESPVKVVAVETGSAVDATKRVTAPTDTFHPGDTLYASVVTEGTAPVVTLGARWIHAGEILAQTTQRIAPEGTAVSEFHVENPSGWAPGVYRLEVLIDGQVVADRSLRVVAAS